MRRSVIVITACTTLSVTADAQSLRGSRASVDRQYTAAVRHDFTFLETSRDVTRFVNLDLLVPMRGGTHYEIAAVSFPYARPAVRTFIDRLSSQYQAACGENLVVTSLTRPALRQPRNASDFSVHPTGMAVDLRVSRSAKCRSWLERTLLALEKTDVIEATRERRPAHYHVAVYPQQYTAYVAGLERRATQVASVSSAAEGSSGSSEAVDYRVHRGDTLWAIARKYGTSVETLKELNGLRTSRIAAGQTLLVPAGN